MPKKCLDPDTFTLPCMIGSHKIERAMLDLGVLINVMPVSLYRELGLTNLCSSGIVIQLADHSCIKPLGIVENVLIRVEVLVFFVDLYVLDMPTSTPSSSAASLLLGRPFMKMVKSDIDVDEGVVSIGFQDKILRFKVFYDIDSPHVLSLEYYMIDSDPVYDRSVNAKSFMCL